MISKKMLRNALVCITERSDEFSKLDAVLGDGDHGTAIVQSMSALVATADKGTEFKSMLNDMSFNLMLEISGSTSTLLGGVFPRNERPCRRYRTGRGRRKSYVCRWTGRCEKTNKSKTGR